MIIMSICLTWFPIGGIGEPIYTINRFIIQELGILPGGCLTAKNLVMVTNRR